MVWANARSALAHTIPQSRVRRSRTTAELWRMRRMLWNIPRSPGAAEPHHRRALANAGDVLEYSTIPGCGGAAPPPGESTEYRTLSHSKDISEGEKLWIGLPSQQTFLNCLELHGPFSLEERH